MRKLQNIEDTLESVNEYFSPKIVDEVNSVYIKVAKIKGEKVPWHTHENEDELFYVIKGKLLMEVEDLEPIIMRPGDMYVVSKGLLHRVSSEEECSIILIENKETKHTGKVQSKITKSIEDQF